MAPNCTMQRCTPALQLPEMNTGSQSAAFSRSVKETSCFTWSKSKLHLSRVGEQKRETVFEHCLGLLFKPGSSQFEVEATEEFNATVHKSQAVVGVKWERGQSDLTVIQPEESQKESCHAAS